MPSTEEALRGGRDLWNSFKESQGGFVQVKQVNISSFIIQGLNLSNCSFSHSRLIGIRFDNCTLDRFTLRNCVLHDVSFTHCRGTALEVTTADAVNLKVDECIFQNATFSNFSGSLSHSDLSLSKFHGTTFKKVMFTDCDVSKASFQQADFTDATLQNVRMPNCTLERVNFTNCTFSNVSLAGSTITNTSFEHILRHPEIPNDTPFLDLTDATLENATFDRAPLRGAVFTRSTMRTVTFNSASLQHAIFTSARLYNVALHAAVAPNSTWSDASLDNSNGDKFVASNGNFDRAKLHNCGLTGSDFSNASMRDADLRKSRLLDATLNGADLRNANLTDSALSGSRVLGTKITRQDLEELRLHNYWGLRETQLHEMSIEDNLATLRAYFGGLWAWYHTLTTAIWLLPVATLILRTMVLSLATIGDAQKTLVSIPIGSQLLGYIKSGYAFPLKSEEGQTWSYGVDYVFLGSFLAMALYNIARIALVLDVKMLEHKLAISSLHPRVALTPRRRVLMFVIRYGVALYVTIALLHAWRFLSSPHLTLYR